MGLLRRVFNVAIQNGWILRNPFAMGNTLINPGDEKQRERILTRDEEEKLLAVCTGAKAHLRPVIIMALDTGMRRGEMFKLKWSDIDFENGIVNIHAFNTKTMRQRQVAITSRLAQELKALWESSPRNPDDLVFGVANVKKAYSKARVAAGLPDLRCAILTQQGWCQNICLCLRSVEFSDILRPIRPIAMSMPTWRRQSGPLPLSMNSISQRMTARRL